MRVDEEDVRGGLRQDTQTDGMGDQEVDLEVRVGPESRMRSSPMAGAGTSSAALGRWAYCLMPPKPDERLVEVVSDAVRTLLTDGEPAGASVLAAADTDPSPSGRRRPVPVVVQAEVFGRDHFCCRYCGTRTIAVPVLRALSAIYPDLFPYHPHWKAGVTHPAYLGHSASIDHVVPVAHGGHPRDPANLVTACWPCNLRKGELTLERLGWSVLPEPEVPWDGLVGHYPALWLLAAPRSGASEVRYHTSWLAALARVRPGPDGGTDVMDGAAWRASSGGEPTEGPGSPEK